MISYAKIAWQRNTKIGLGKWGRKRLFWWQYVGEFKPPSSRATKGLLGSTSSRALLLKDLFFSVAQRRKTPQNEFPIMEKGRDKLTGDLWQTVIHWLQTNNNLTSSSLTLTQNQFFSHGWNFCPESLQRTALTWQSHKCLGSTEGMKKDGFYLWYFKPNLQVTSLFLDI